MKTANTGFPSTVPGHSNGGTGTLTVFVPVFFPYRIKPKVVDCTGKPVDDDLIVSQNMPSA